MSPLFIIPSKHFDMHFLTFFKVYYISSDKSLLFPQESSSVPSHTPSYVLDVGIYRGSKLNTSPVSVLQTCLYNHERKETGVRGNKLSINNPNIQNMNSWQR